MERGIKDPMERYRSRGRTKRFFPLILIRLRPAGIEFAGEARPKPRRRVGRERDEREDRARERERRAGRVCIRSSIT